MDKFLKKCNIKLLRDEAVLIEDAFYLYGRPDYERPGRGIEKRKTPEEITEELDKRDVYKRQELLYTEIDFTTSN